MLFLPGQGSREVQQGHGQEALDGRAFGYLVQAAYLLWDIGVGLRDAIADDLKSGPLRVAFAEAESETDAIWAVCPTTRLCPPKVCVLSTSL